MTSTKPTIFIVHGAWHSAAHFVPLISLFKQAGYPVICPTQPTYNCQPPTKTLYDDATFTRSILTDLIEKEQKEVIMIMHSYGGVVGTEAVTEELATEVRQARGLKGGVARLLYMTAFVLPLGDSLVTTLGGTLPPIIKVEEDGSCNVPDPRCVLYHDLSESEQDRWISELKPHPAGAASNPLTNVAYKYVPSTYLFCDDDQALPLAVQKSMVKASGVGMDEVSCKSSHAPFLSMPERIVDIIEGWRVPV